MNRAGILSFAQPASQIVKRIEPIRRINIDPSDMLYRSIAFQTRGNKQLCHHRNHRVGILRSVFPRERHGLIARKNLLIKRHSWFSGKSKTRCNRETVSIFNLKTHKWASCQHVVHRSDYFNICIEIHPAVFAQYPKTGIVADKSILSRSIRVSRIGQYVDIKIIFVPFLNLIVRKIILPALNTPLS